VDVPFHHPAKYTITAAIRTAARFAEDPQGGRQGGVEKEAEMKFRMTWKTCAGAFLVFALASALAAVAEAADKKKIVWSKTERQTLVESKMVVDGIPGRELAQGIYLDTHKSPDPEFDASVARVYNQDENGADGNGVHKGLEINYFKSGDQLFQRYEGTHKIISHNDGGWEVTYQGKSQIIGGTGKYANARGFVNYRGRITPESFSEENTGEVVY
jgi:hypothetical protein